MNILILIGVSFSISGFIIIYLSRKWKYPPATFSKLYHSSDEDSYTEAKTVFKTLSKANIDINFLAADKDEYSHL